MDFKALKSCRIYDYPLACTNLVIGEMFQVNSAMFLIITF